MTALESKRLILDIYIYRWTDRKILLFSERLQSVAPYRRLPKVEVAIDIIEKRRLPEYVCIEDIQKSSAIHLLPPDHILHNGVSFTPILYRYSLS